MQTKIIAPVSFLKVNTQDEQTQKITNFSPIRNISFNEPRKNRKLNGITF
jgi:hypothetical protein